MKNLNRGKKILAPHLATLPAAQRAIRTKCYHPTGDFKPFPEEAVHYSISARFEDMVRLYPERLAIKTCHKAVTYGELNQQANRIAHAICALSGPELGPVALLMHEGTATVTTLLGALKAQKLFVILDPSLPETRLAILLQNARADWLITDSAHRPMTHRLGHQPARVLQIDELKDSYSTENPALSEQPDRPAYVVYTSGSTGEPTGVLHNHLSVLFLVRRLTNVYHICAEDRLAPLQAWSFAGSVRTALCALLNGAALFPFDLKRKGVHKLAHWLLQQTITITNPFASAFRQFVSTLPKGEAFPHLRLLIMGGEPLYKSDVELYRKHFMPSCILAHVMGSTELSTTRMYFIDGQTPVIDEVVPAGYGVEEADTILLDATGAEVGGCGIGETAVRSRYLAVGYWRDPRLTAARFVPDPAGGGGRIYLTGDVGMLLPDGCLLHRGRKEFLAKIRGYRINPSEVEMALLKAKSVQQAVVLARESLSGETRLIAYIVPNLHSAPTVTDLRSSLAKRLPDYMIPTVFVILETFPRTSNGKIDRRALPLPSNSRPQVGTAYVSPRNTVERELTRIWAEVLSLDQVGIQDTFSELGGHSLLATQVITRVIETFKVELPIRFLLRSPTVADMAVIITENIKRKAGDKVLAQMFAEVEIALEEESEKGV